MNEWQEEFNSFGGIRRFRMVDGVKEYEAEITVEGGITIPESQIEAYNQRKRELQEAARKATPEKPVFCPFNGGTSCKTHNCALFVDAACNISTIAKPSGIETAGKKCPFTPYQCRPDCALYASGCMLTGKNHI